MCNQTPPLGFLSFKHTGTSQALCQCLLFGFVTLLRLCNILPLACSKPSEQRLAADWPPPLQEVQCCCGTALSSLLCREIEWLWVPSVMHVLTVINTSHLDVSLAAPLNPAAGKPFVDHTTASFCFIMIFFMENFKSVQEYSSMNLKPSAPRGAFTTEERSAARNATADP